MNYSYLENGQECVVKEKTEKGYYVHPVLFFEDYEIDEVEVFGPIELVQKVYKKPPVKKINEEIVKLDAFIEEKQQRLKDVNERVQSAVSELNRLRTEVAFVSRSNVSLKAFKRDGWTTMTLFRTDSFVPRIINRNTMEVKQIESVGVRQSVNSRGELTAWFYLSDSRDSMYNSNHRLDLNWGIQYDAPIEVIQSFACGRFRQEKDRWLRNHTPETLLNNLDYIPEEFYDEIREKVAEKAKTIKKRLIEEIAKKQEELDNL